MITRRAECSCGQLSATCSGEPWTTTSEEMTKFMADDLARFGDAVKLTGAKAE